MVKGQHHPTAQNMFLVGDSRANKIFSFVCIALTYHLICESEPDWCSETQNLKAVITVYWFMSSIVSDKMTCLFTKLKLHDKLVWEQLWIKMNSQDLTQRCREAETCSQSCETLYNQNMIDIFRNRSTVQVLWLCGGTSDRTSWFKNMNDWFIKNDSYSILAMTGRAHFKTWFPDNNCVFNEHFNTKNSCVCPIISNISFDERHTFFQKMIYFQYATFLCRCCIFLKQNNNFKGPLYTI